MADLIAQRDRKLGNFVSAPALAEYAPRYREHFVLDREGGVLTVRMHTDGGSAQWSRGLLNAWNQMLRDVGADRHNEVIIFTGTGQHWIGGVQPSSFAQPMSRWPSDMVDEQLTDGIKALERLVLDVDVPTIAAVNGPGPRQELGLLCDITICADTTTFADGNFTAGSVPGDGMHLMFAELIGPKRAAHLAYTGAILSAEQALALGLVSEVLPGAKVLPRAQEIASSIMVKPRASRRLTHALIARTWQRRLIEDLRSGYTHQLFAMTRS